MGRTRRTILLPASICAAALVAWSALAGDVSRTLDVGSALPGDLSRLFAGSQAERPVSVQLHLHGPLSEFNGSMDWHVRQAHDVGVDVLWWTEHDWRVALDTYTPRFDFESCVWDGNVRRFLEPDLAGEQRWWEIRYAALSHKKSIVDSLAYEGARSLRLSVAGLPGETPFQRLRLLQGASRRQNHYPLASNARLRFALFPESLDASGAKFVVQAKLSEHATEWPALRYVLGATDEEDVDAIVLPFVAGRWNTYELDFAGDARRLLSLSGADTLYAQDNSLYELEMELCARDGVQAVVFLDDLRYVVDPGRAGLSLLDWQRTAAGYYESRVPDVLHHVGTEISRYRPQPHLNAYLPEPWLPDYAGHAPDESIDWAVDQVHARGGLVSYNHPWGPGIYLEPAEPPQQRAARILRAKQDQLATRLLGCDLLEVGYRVRAGIDLAGHLDLWDCLTANAIFVTGIGVTDSHGSDFSTGWTPWQPSEHMENNYVTWLWATGQSEVPLLSALGSGRAYFGDPYRWKGELDLATSEGFPMGRVVLTDQPSHDVIIRAASVPITAELRLVQGEIRTDRAGSTEVQWLRRETLTAAAANGVLCDTVSVDASVPSFVRAELWNGSEECAFSNPLHFLRDVPPGGVAARRLATSLGGLRVRRAEGFLLRAVRLDPEANRLTLGVEETAPGLGVAELDTGEYGAPVAVEGAADWSYATGVLTLRDFGGSGDVVVRWDGPALPQLDDVVLSAGRPNPFGQGFALEFALPDPGTALVEVLDVHGRRVRILHDAWTPAGWHAMTWDGRDAYGRRVADGVYWIRLRALGITRTTKAVKVR